jgi:8-oxo-dGTP pyrophosphatase MutT (NUDIX family)
VIAEYYINEYSTWANALALTTDRRVVLVRQYRHGIRAVHFELPGGVAEPGEEPLAAAQRELLEETGYGGGRWEPLTVLSANPALQTNLCHTFLATGVELKQSMNLDATEELTVRLVTIDELRRIVLEGEVIQALHMAPMLKFLMLHA